MWFFFHDNVISVSLSVILLFSLRYEIFVLLENYLSSFTLKKKERKKEKKNIEADALAGQRLWGTAGGAGPNCRRRLCPSGAWRAGPRQRPCPARSRSCDGRGCLWAWQSRGAAAVRRSKVPRDSEGNALTLCASPEPTKQAERPLGSAWGRRGPGSSPVRGVGVQRPQAPALAGHQQAEPPDYLALESNVRDLPRAGTVFLIKSRMDVQEKSMSSHINHVSPGSLLKSIVHR